MTDELENNGSPTPAKGEPAPEDVKENAASPAEASAPENAPPAAAVEPPPPVLAVPIEAPRPPVLPQIRLDKKHPLAIRWMHWINFPVLFTMIWSGLLIYWNDSDNAYKHPHAVYRLGVGPFTVVRFFPQWFWKAMNAPYHVTEGLGFHFFFAWIFAINGFLYVLFTIFSGEWRFVVPDRKSLIQAIQVTLKDLHLSNVPPPADQIQRRTKNCLHFGNFDGPRESHHWPRDLQADPVALGDDFVGRLRDGAMGAFSADHGLLRILPHSRDPGGAGGVEQFPQHGEWTGSEADPGALT